MHATKLSALLSLCITSFLRREWVYILIIYSKSFFKNVFMYRLMYKCAENLIIKQLDVAQ